MTHVFLVKIREKALEKGENAHFDWQECNIPCNLVVH